MLRPPAMLAFLLVAAVTWGCKKADESEVDDRPSPNLISECELGVETPVRMWGQPADCTYAGTAGEVVSLSVTRTDPGLDPNVQLLDPYGIPEAFDDDGGGQGDALIQRHTLASTGTYTVRLRTDEDRTGEVARRLDVEGKGPVEGMADMPMTTDEPLTTEAIPTPTPQTTPPPENRNDNSTPPP